MATTDSRRAQQVLVEAPAEIVTEIHANAIVLRDVVKRRHPGVQFSEQAARDVAEALYSYCLLFRMVKP